jgi:predicted RNA-binding protein (virulence factor B family)
MNEFAILRVVDILPIGAFLNQNQEKDLLLPTSEQTRKLQIGDEVLVYVFEDKQNRPVATMRFDRYLANNTDGIQLLKVEQKVNLIIYAETDLGYKALIDQKFTGVLYKNEVFKKLNYLEETVGYIKKIREDKKIDLILQPFGNKGADDLGLRILEALEDHNGQLNITDKTNPDVIYKMFQVSKKKFKIALGGLYKKKLIKIDENGIQLV